MVNHPLNRARLLEIAPANRLAFLETLRRKIDAQIERLQTNEVRLWNGRSRRYHLQHLYWRLQKLAALAQEAGYADWSLGRTEVG